MVEYDLEITNNKGIQKGHEPIVLLIIKYPN